MRYIVTASIVVSAAKDVNQDFGGTARIAGAVTELPRVRLDKWLWAARFFKTRSLASEAVDAGRVDVNGERAKRSRQVQSGDTISIRRPPFEQHVVVRGVAELRGPAAVAAKLYEETAASLEQRTLLAYQLKNAPVLMFGEGGRPTKRNRRVIERLKGRG